MTSPYELRSNNPQKPNPIELVGTIYDLKSKKLMLHIHATYELKRRQQIAEGVQSKGVWFSATVERDCDLIPEVVFGVKLPNGFRFSCKSLNGWGVFVTREEFEQIDVSNRSDFEGD